MKRKMLRIMALTLSAMMGMGAMNVYADDTKEVVHNSKYNSLDFITNSMPEPSLRFTGTTKEEYTKWQQETKAKLLEVMGISNLERANAQPKLLERVDCGSYTRLKYEIDTTKDLAMPFYVLRPKENKSNGKAAIAIHGHGSDGKEGLVGTESEDYKSSVEKYHYTYAMELLEKGYTVYVPDLLGAGERTLGIYKNTTAECNDINNALTSLGYSLQGIITFENLVLTDYIASQNYDAIVNVGFSGGGQSALWLGVMSDKIDTTIVSGFLHSYKETLLFNNRCGCNFIPNMWKYVDMGDIVALAADKDIYFETGNQDKLNGDRGINGVNDQIAIANKAFKLYDKKVQLKVCEGSHQWYGAWMDKL